LLAGEARRTRGWHAFALALGIAPTLVAHNLIIKALQ